jgi:hypothetical protein
MYDTDALAARATILQRLDRLPLTWTLWRPDGYVALATVPVRSMRG